MHYHVRSFPVQHSRPKNNAAICQRPLNASMSRINTTRTGWWEYILLFLSLFHEQASKLKAWSSMSKGTPITITPCSSHTRTHTQPQTHTASQRRTADSRHEAPILQTYECNICAYEFITMQRSRGERQLPMLRTVAAETPDNTPTTPN